MSETPTMECGALLAAISPSLGGITMNLVTLSVISPNVVGFRPSKILLI
ncbi:MAG TPA: hypothetical protein VKK79_03745 [Candidatus Lokiarchaeia archaeon]|nr:hypothetical protein [Candidatus Lokiarchaeia archaeon]